VGSFRTELIQMAQKSKKYFKMFFLNKSTNRMQQQETVASGWLIYLKCMMMHEFVNFKFILKCNLRPSVNYGFYCVDFL
jgi:hypothetical protein